LAADAIPRTRQTVGVKKLWSPCPSPQRNISCSMSFQEVAHLIGYISSLTYSFSKRWERQPNKLRWMISVSAAKELLFLNKSEIKGYGVTYPVRGRVLESANALHVHIQGQALPIGPCTPSFMLRTYETPIHQIECTQNEDKNECKNKARVLLSSDILWK
jgi:hypothetical protein